jgi:hypothetical protein
LPAEERLNQNSTACDLQAKGIKMNKYLILAGAAALAGTCFSDTVIDFNGQSTTGNNNAYVAPPVDGLYNWTDSGVSFRHEVTFGGFGWEGFSYSSVNDTATGGFGNQYAVYGDGMGMGDAGSYAVFYKSAPATITLPVATTVRGFYANNTTYAALDMINGSGFSKQFTTNDWFRLTVEGFDEGSASLGSVDFDLADFAGFTEGDDRNNYMVNDWTFVDLSSLGTNVASLAFSLSSSDNGDFGMNTPAYFAMDDLTVEAIPEPGTITLILLSAAGLVGFRRLHII